ncbi:MAG: GTP-binding protein [Gammaproteobacteria bacterium]
MDDRYAGLIPVTLITGFLGSGKTTLLQRLLASPRLANTAVLINEFGEVGLDHLLVEHVDADTVVLASGCICCTIRTDLSTAMRDLYDKRERGKIKAFDRLVIETTGLADPAPIVYTLVADPVLCHHFRLGKVITTVDAVNGAQQLRENPESIKQAAIADRILLTKTDLAAAAQIARLKTELRRLNPAAPIIESAGVIDPDDLLVGDLYDIHAKSREVRHWLEAEASEAHEHHEDEAHDVNRHDRNIVAFCLSFDQPLDWTAFGIWLTMLLNVHGDNVLRIKGILNVCDAETPVVIHGVQHTIHPPVHLAAWPDGDRRSRIVFITRDLPRAPIEASLAAFNGLANRSPSTDTGAPVPVQSLRSRHD